MSEEHKTKIGAAELADFGMSLNAFHDKDWTYEMEDDKRRMRAYSLSDVITRFQTFYNGKIESFKLRIHMTDHRGIPMHKTIEYRSEARV